MNISLTMQCVCFFKANSAKKILLYTALIVLVINPLYVFTTNEMFFSNTEYGNKIIMGDFYYSRDI